MTGHGIKVLTVVAVLVAGMPATGWALPPQAGVTIGIANVVVAQASQTAGDQSAASATADAGGLSDATKQSIGCVVTSGSALSYAVFWAGASESLMIVAGGLLAPSMSSTVFLGLTSTLIGSTCALGAGLTPLVLWAAEQKDNIAASLAWHAQQTSTALATLVGTPPKSEPRQLAERTE